MPEPQPNEIELLRSLFTSKQALVAAARVAAFGYTTGGRILLLAEDLARARAAIEEDARTQPFRSKIDYREGLFVARAAEFPRPHPMPSNQHSESKPGFAIGTSSSSGGTLGSVLKTASGTERYLLTAGHALGDPPSDIAQNPPQVFVAEAFESGRSYLCGRWIAHGAQQNGRLVTDWGLVRAEHTDASNDLACSRGNGLNLPTQPATMQAGDPLLKCGAMTGARAGLFVEIPVADVWIEYPLWGRVHSIDHFVISNGPGLPFASDGDSGSMVFRKNERELEAVGMLLTRSDNLRHYAAAPIHTILDDISKKTGLSLTFA